MDYKEFNDNELLFMVKENNEESENILIEKYSHLIDAIIKKYLKATSNLGLDDKDLYQEGMLGLIHAIKTFKEEKNVLFYTYATVCIESSIKSALRSASRKKNIVLNNSVSLETDINEDIKLYDILVSDEENQLDKVILKEKEDLIKEYFNSSLTKFERKVFDLKLKDVSNQEIANILNKEKRSIENTIQRIKQKYKKYINENTL